jgi:uncharacterized cupin superfamily protein
MLINPDNIPEVTSSNYPLVFQHLVAGRTKKRLGDVAGLTNFGVNLVTLKPGSCSSIRHWHSHQDEFIYIIQGEVTLITNSGETILQAGNMAGFAAGKPDGHHLINYSDAIAIYLEIGDRTAGDTANYPDTDLVAQHTSDGWMFLHRDGSLY